MYSQKNFKVLLISFLLLISFTNLFGYFIPDTIKSDTIDIDNWKVISFPFDERIDKAVILDSLNGWVWGHDKGHLYQYKQGKWYLTDYLSGIDYQLFFGYFNNYLWFLCRDVMNYRYFILLINENEQRRLYPPNADRIRDLCYLSDDNIWCGCEWGEILHYDGKNWKLIPTPTFVHIHRILVIDNNNYWIFGESHNQKIVYSFSNGRWYKEDMQLYEFGSGSVYRIKRLNDSYNYFSMISNDRLLKFGISNLEEIKFSEIISDTVNLVLHAVKNPIIYHSSGSIQISGGDRIYVKSFRQNKMFLYNSLEKKVGKAYILTRDGYLTRIKLNYEDFLQERNEQFLHDLIEGNKDEYGVSFNDVDNDGDDDLYIINTEERNILKLYKGNPENKPRQNITFLETTQQFEILGLIKFDDGTHVYDFGICWADIENDGDRDAYITSMYGENELFENMDNERFQDIADKARVTGGKSRSSIASWGDVDKDGDVDLFVTNEDTTNMLFLNDGAGQFRDGTKAAGLFTEQRGKGCTFGDIDDDGDLDLVVTFFGRHNKIYRNMGIDRETKLPCFIDDTDRCLPVNADSLAKSTSAVLADVDNDGDLDLYITNLIFTNRLYQNDGNGIFKDITDAANVRDSSLSHSSCFFDADNDGDLDFYVTNRGKNQFFINNRDGTFIQNDKLFESMDQLAYSTGFACGDPDNDGDVDCYLANTDEDGIYYDNKLDNQNYLKIKLMGTKSNRDAIGAKTWLYEAGHLNEQDFCLGLREINGGSGYGCQNSLVIHYGVDHSKKYDLKVHFPSGITKIIHDINPTQQLVIEEEIGLAKKWTLAKKWIMRLLKKNHNQTEFVEFLILFLLLFFSTILLKKKYNLECRHVLFVLVIPISFYLTITSLLFETHFILGLALPYTIAIISYLTIAFLLRQKKTKIEKEKVAEELLLNCRAFDHGEWAVSYLNQLQLFSTNLQAAQKISDNMAKRLNETITGFYDEVYSGITNIYQMASEVPEISAYGLELERQLLFLSDNLNKVKVQLNIRNKVDSDVWKSIYRVADDVRVSIKSIRNQASRYILCDAMVLLDNAINRYRERFEYPIYLNMDITKSSTKVSIRDSELAAILDNLFRNADQAMETQFEKRIDIKCKTTDQFFIMEFSDRGKGIAKKDWERVFQQNYSSKKDGGFGLYYSKRVLKKYGGEIEVLKSVKNKGTTFRLKLGLIWE